MYPDDLRYSKTHEWIRPGDPATAGITHYAQDELGDVVYVELPDVGRLGGRREVWLGGVGQDRLRPLRAREW
jgi:glycine cleavage system H protein